MGVTGFDHVAMPTADASRLVAFYRELGFGVFGEQEWRDGTGMVVTLTFGDNKINVHPETLVARRGDPTYLRAPLAEPGSADLCFVWDGPVDELLAAIEKVGAKVESQPHPVPGGRGGGRMKGVAMHVRDPDDNLIEFISYDPEELERYTPAG
jgi:catechol 2,3-dioxygenase-like lactoylglutathione lyase family enzyme